METREKSIRDRGFDAGACAAGRGESVACPYPAGSWQAVEWEAGYEAGYQYFTACNPWA